MICRPHIPHFLLVLLLLLLVMPAAPAAATTDAYTPQSDLETHYQQAKFFFNQLKTTSTLGASRDNWLKGAGNFRRIYLAEPKSDLAPACLLMLGRLYSDMYRAFGKGIDLGEAISYYRDVDALFPGNRLADDALFAVGLLLLEDVHDPQRAAKSFGRIVTDYPEGDMRSTAETKLKELSQKYDIPLPRTMVGDPQLMNLTNVLPVKYWSSDDYTRVVINTSGPVTYREELLERVGNQPRRLYIDFQESYIEPRFRAPVPIEDGLLKRIRTGQFSPDTVRVVLDIESISSYKIFSLPSPFRVVIDVRGQDKITAEDRRVGSSGPPALPPTPTPPTPTGRRDRDGDAETRQPSLVEQRDNQVRTPIEPAENKTEQSLVVLRERKKTGFSQSPAGDMVVSQTPSLPATDGRRAPLSLAQQLGLGVRTIVLDPGHGGKDPGAIAYGMKEKDIVLHVAKRLADELRRTLGVTVILTREDDVFLPLEERTAIANTSGADLFVSLHINAHPSPQIKGFETYFLNLSTNDEAMRVAARENATSTHQMSDLQDILLDIMRNSKINESSRLARQVHGSMAGALTAPPFILKDMGVKQAPFYVLIGAEMPAILIELAFISNPDDARLLADATFIDELAGTISIGIRSYIHATTAQL
jgi:N-acetylmuramoyl-L-alanine amidase